MAGISSEQFLAYAQAVRPEIEAALDRYTQYGADCPAVLRAAIRHSLLAGGKRLRPLLVLMSAQACGSARGEAMPAACAVEMVHTYSLIHDDLPAMDDDQWRRGIPCCHVQFGEANAILAGDALLAQAFEVLSGELQPAPVAAACCLELARAAGASALVGGQVDDLQGTGAAGDLDQLERIHRRKTGAMFQVSLRLGGRIAQADPAQIAALDDFGKKLGLAFQIIDDLLDIKGEAAALGKSIGKDRQQAKLTFPALLGLAASQQFAGQLVQEAGQALSPFGTQAACLQSLAHYVLERNR